jgi:hypothetical protein
MTRFIFLAGLVWFSLLAAACANEQPLAEPTAVLSSTPLVEVTGPPGGPPTLGPIALTEVPGTVWLADLDGGDLHTLYQDASRSSAPPTFFEKDADAVQVWGLDGERPVLIRYGLDGRELSRDYNPPQQDLPWTSSNDGCEVQGRLYPGIPCGSLSPNGRWMIYSFNGRDLPVSGRAGDLWAVDLKSGASVLLQEGVTQCTQCDVASRYEWSPGGDHLLVAESGPTTRVFLIDLRGPDVRELERTQGYGDPVWSPVRDQLAYWDDAGRTILEDVGTGFKRSVSAQWPVRFDPSGRYVYTTDNDEATVFVDADTGTVMARLLGGPGYDAAGGNRYLPPVTRPVVATATGLIAVLGPTPDCRGSVLYVDSAARKCFSSAGMPVFSPDSSRVAMARKTGDTGRVKTPSMEALNMHVFEIVVVDVDTGAESIVARGALGLDAPPRMEWNAAGTHLLVSWPAYYGL